LKSRPCRRIFPPHSEEIGTPGARWGWCVHFALNSGKGSIARTSEDKVVQKFPMTAQGLQRLEEELRHLKTFERPGIIRAIAEARGHGDLSENAEYHAARERQSFIEGRIAELEEIIAAAEVIDTSRLSGEQIKFGAVVQLLDEETEKECTYQIVGAHEADIKEGRLSISSPLDRTYEILSVRYQ
jgi:transcription elongation factor GreA